MAFDKTYGHASYGCTFCCGIKSTWLWYDPLGWPTGFTSPNGVDGRDSCSLEIFDLSWDFYSSWQTGNTGIATVDGYGVHTGVSVGSTTSSASGEEQSGSWRTQCPLVVFNPSGGDNVQPTINGPNTVWWFNGLSQSGYATSITLTSTGGGSTSWAVTAGADKINLSSTTGASINVTSSGSYFSSAVGDIKITATAGGQTSAPFSITTRTPNRAVPGTITTTCDSAYGYLTFLNYTAQDQLGTELSNGFSINEDWATGVINDYSGTNWDRAAPNGDDMSGSAFADMIGGANLAIPRIPVPTCDGDSTKVHHWGQEWRIGSTTPGLGRRIQTNTLQRYKGRAVHLSIVSPAP